MTVEEHLKQLIGDLVFTVAKQQAEIDAMKTQQPPPDPPKPEAAK